MLRGLCAHEDGVYEILYYKKNGHGIWLQEEITLIRNEQDTLVLFLVSFRDITAFRDPLPGGGMMTNLSKFAKLAWTMTRSRQQATANASSPSGITVPNKLPALGGESTAAVLNKSSTETIQLNTDSNIISNVNHVSKSSNLDNTSIVENSTDAVITEDKSKPHLNSAFKVNGEKKLKV